MQTDNTAALLKAKLETVNQVVSNIEIINSVFLESMNVLPENAPLRRGIMRAMEALSNLLSWGRVTLAPHSTEGKETLHLAEIEDFFEKIKTFDFSALLKSVSDLPLSRTSSLNALWRDLSYALLSESNQIEASPKTSKQVVRKERPPVLMKPADPPLTKDVMRRMPFKLHIETFLHLRENFQVRGELTSGHLKCLVHAHLLLAGLLEAVMPVDSVEVQVKYLDEIVRHHTMVRHFNRMYKADPRNGGVDLVDESRLKAPEIHARATKSAPPPQETLVR